MTIERELKRQSMPCSLRTVTDQAFDDEPIAALDLVCHYVRKNQPLGRTDDLFRTS